MLIRMIRVKSTFRTLELCAVCLNQSSKQKIHFILLYILWSRCETRVALKHLKDI